MNLQVFCAKKGSFGKYEWIPSHWQQGNLLSINYFVQSSKNLLLEITEAFLIYYFYLLQLPTIQILTHIFLIQIQGENLNILFISVQSQIQI